MGVLISLLLAGFGAGQIIYQKEALKKVSPSALSVISLLFIAVIFSPFLFTSNLPSSRILLIMAFKSLISSIYLILFLQGIKHVPVSYSAPTKSITPIFGFILSYLIIGDEKFSIYHIVGILLTIIGLILLNTEYQWWKDKVTYFAFFVYLILPRIIASLGSVLDKVALTEKSNDVSTITIFAIDRLFYLICLLPFFFLTKNRLSGIKKPNGFLVRAVLLYFLTEITYFFLLSFNTVSYVLSIRRIDSVIAAFVGGKIFKEKNYGKNVLAALIIFIGASLVILNDFLENLI